MELYQSMTKKLGWGREYHTGNIRNMEVADKVYDLSCSLERVQSLMNGEDGHHDQSLGG